MKGVTTSPKRGVHESLPSTPKKSVLRPIEFHVEGLRLAGEQDTAKVAG